MTSGTHDARRTDVLIIDDDDDVRELLSLVLRKCGYSVETAADGQEALERLASVQPDLIFLDLQMPVMNGAEFRQRQRQDRELIKIPTVVMTGSGWESQLDPAIRATLRKPTRNHEVMAIVRQYCAAR